MYAKPSLGWGKREAEGVSISRVYLAWVSEGGREGGKEEDMYVYRTERVAKIRKKRERKRKAKGFIREDEERSIKSNKKNRRREEKEKTQRNVTTIPHDNKKVGGVASLDKLSPPIPPATEIETKTVTASQVKTCALHATQ